MAKSGIKTDEWAAELQRLGAVGAGDAGKTTMELAADHNIKLRTMQAIIYKGVKDGLYIKGYGYREDGAGRRQRVPVYRVKGEGD